MAATSTSMPQSSHSRPGLRLAAQSGLDVMLTDAVLDAGGVGRFLKPRAASRTIAGLARHPHRTARDAAGLGVELARVAAGRSDSQPAKGDRRFGDRGWHDNWLFHRLMQTYLATGRGYVDGRSLSGVFAWLRPNDLVWNYVVNNYLFGKDPPAFDILYWNQDTVRLAAGLHRDFVRIALGNGLAVPGDVEALGTSVDLGTIPRDCYTIAGLNDHIVPWENAYRSAQPLGGDKRFALSTSGHIQALVNPPSADSRASYRVTNDPERDADEWLPAADVRRGSWWPDYQDWLAQRAGERKPAPKTLGSRQHKATAKAPGNYVHAS
jgi:hypothetical protein